MDYKTNLFLLPQFDQFSRTVADAAVVQRQAVVDGLKAYASAMSVAAESAGQTWPFVRIPYYEEYGASFRQVAKSEIPGMNEQKKDVLYQLGSAYEQQGDMEKAMVEFKALYGADISYRDVAQKIENFYSKS